MIMNRLKYYLLIFTMLLVSNFIIAQTFEYVSPKDNSFLVSLGTNIILKSTGEIDPSSLSQIEFYILGSVSGETWWFSKIV